MAYTHVYKRLNVIKKRYYFRVISKVKFLFYEDI